MHRLVALSIPSRASAATADEVELALRYTGHRSADGVIVPCVPRWNASRRGKRVKSDGKLQRQVWSGLTQHHTTREEFSRPLLQGSASRTVRDRYDRMTTSWMDARPPCARLRGAYPRCAARRHIRRPRRFQDRKVPEFLKTKDMDPPPPWYVHDVTAN
jgi:hypothetical protein